MIASSGTAISTVVAVGDAAVDVNEGDVGKVATPVFYPLVLFFQFLIVV